MSKSKTPAVRDSKGRFVKRAAAVAVATVDLAPVAILVVGCERLDPAPSLRREVLPPVQASQAPAGALVRSVGTKGDKRRRSSSAVSLHTRTLSGRLGSVAVWAVVVLCSVAFLWS